MILDSSAVVAILRREPGHLELEDAMQGASFGDRHSQAAIDAFNRYGSHPARLNYGHCMTYATARLAEEPLLFVGNDFSMTDIAPV